MLVRKQLRSNKLQWPVVGPRRQRHSTTPVLMPKIVANDLRKASLVNAIALQLLTLFLRIWQPVAGSKLWSLNCSTALGMQAQVDELLSSTRRGTKRVVDSEECSDVKKHEQDFVENAEALAWHEESVVTATPGASSGQVARSDSLHCSPVGGDPWLQRRDCWMRRRQHQAMMQSYQSQSQNPKNNVKHMVDRQQAVPHRRVNMKPNQVKVQAKIFSRRSAVTRRDESGPVRDPSDDMQVDEPSPKSSSRSIEPASKIMHIVARPCRPQKMMNTSSLQMCAKLNTKSRRLGENRSELVDLGHVNASQAHELSRLIAHDVFALISHDWSSQTQRQSSLAQDGSTTSTTCWMPSTMFHPRSFMLVCQKVKDTSTFAFL